MLISVGLNIPLLREVISFVYLLFIPGFLITRLMKLAKTDRIKTVLFSISLSLIFLMLIGLLINESSILGFANPLTSASLTICVCFSTSILLFYCYRQKLLNDFNINFKLTNSLFFELVFLFLLPVMSLLGTLFLNIPTLMFIIVIIAVLFILGIFFADRLSPELFPLLIFSVSLALLIQVVFSSQNLIGSDVNLEYYFFKLTQNNNHWAFINPIINSGAANFDAMLSITLLPTVFSSVTNIPGVLLFKLLYPTIFSLIPVVLYKIYDSQIGKTAALASVFFFISGLLVFYGYTPLSLNRQITATFFFLLSILILFDKTQSPKNKKLLLVLFGVAISVSHYAIAYIYLALILFTFLFLKITKRTDQVLTGRMTLLLSAIMFFWNVLAESPIISLTQFINSLFSSFFTDFLNVSSRTTGSFLSSPVSNIGSFSTNLSLSIFYIVHFLIAFGVIILVFKPKRIGLDFKYRCFSVLSAILLFLCFAVPNFAPRLNMDRFYAITLLFLAPFFWIGTNILFDFFKKPSLVTMFHRFTKRNLSRLRLVIVCLLITCFFLTQTGFVNRIIDAPPLIRAVDLDRVQTSNDIQINLNYYTQYSADQDVFGAKWISQYRDPYSAVFGDFSTAMPRVLVSYGLVPPQQLNYLENNSLVDDGSLVFLGTYNTVYGFINIESVPINLSNIDPLLNHGSLIYTNGNSQVWLIEKTTVLQYSNSIA